MRWAGSVRLAHFALPQAGQRKAVSDLAPALTMTRGHTTKKAVVMAKLTVVANNATAP